jgi:hypothetical protein
MADPLPQQPEPKHASDLIKDLSNVPNIIGGLGLSIATAQKAFDTEYLDSIERILALIKIMLGRKKDDGAGKPTDLSDEEKESLAGIAPFIEGMLTKLAPSRYQFTETSLSVKLDLAQSMQIGGTVGLGFGVGAVSVSAAFSIAYSYDYRAAAECRTVIHAYPTDQAVMAALLTRADKLADKALVLPERSRVDNLLFEKSSELLTKMTTITAPLKPKDAPKT